MATKLYVANTSKQHHEFCYRLIDERATKLANQDKPRNAEGEIVLQKHLRSETIQVGTQVLIGGGKLSEKNIAEILRQYEDKGLRDSTQISRLNEYVGLCYRLDRPVEIDNIQVIFEMNDQRLNERGQELRENTAAAIAQRMQDRSHELGVNLARTELETVEDTKGTPRIAEGYEITTEGHGNRRSGRRTRRANRANA